MPATLRIASPKAQHPFQQKQRGGQAERITEHCVEAGRQTYPGLQVHCGQRNNACAHCQQPQSDRRLTTIDSPHDKQDDRRTGRNAGQDQQQCRQVESHGVYWVTFLYLL